MFNTPKNGKRRYIIRRFSLTEILAVAAIVTSIPGAQYAKVKEKGYEAECFSNLRQIGILMTAYNLENGRYPKAAFYPDDPLSGEDRISVILHGTRKAPRCRCSPYGWDSPPLRLSAPPAFTRSWLRYLPVRGISR